MYDQDLLFSTCLFRYVQRFVSPPALIDGHKFVFRLFALVTSFSPLRVQLYHDGLIFYTFTEYTVANQTAKRSYISDYFFTEKQSDYYVLVQDYLTNLAQQTHYKTTTNHGGSGGGSSSKSQVGGEPQAKQLWVRCGSNIFHRFTMLSSVQLVETDCTIFGPIFPPQHIPFRTTLKVSWSNHWWPL